MRRDAGCAGGEAGFAPVSAPASEGRVAASPPGSAERVAEWLEELATVDPAEFDEGRGLAAITALERMKRAAAAAQARLAVEVDRQARRRQAAAGVPTAQQGVGVGAQIALARMESPHRGGRHLGLAKALVAELPGTLAGMAAGQVSEWQATIVARETACLDPDRRRQIDDRVAARLPGWGERRTQAEVIRLVCAADPAAVVERRGRAESDRRVWIRPAPDTMCYLTALLPVAQGVATYAALLRAADTARAVGHDEVRGGDRRGRGQVMADTLVQRVTGAESAADVAVEVGLVMSAETLFGRADTPALLVGHGPIPAAHARDLVRDTRADVWVRRLFAAPESGQLVAMDSRRRRFEGELRHFVVLRDQFCRTPWCEAPIRHVDHPNPVRGDGQTSAENAQGLCEACNYAKEAPGWTATASSATGVHTVTLTTPIGTRYISTAPDPPGP